MLLPALFALLLTVDPGADLSKVERDLAARQYDGALAGLRQMPAEARSAPWYLLASRTYDGMNQVSKAVEAAETAIRLEPERERGYLQLAQIFLARNTPEAAAGILGDAKKRFPGSPLIGLGLGLAFKDLRQYDQAITVLREVLTLKPDLGAAFDALGGSYMEAGQYSEAIRAATAYIERNPGDYRGYYYLAAGRLKAENFSGEEASLLRRCISLNPGYAAGYALLGKVLLDAGQVSPAIEALEKAIQLRPGYTPAHLTLASAYNQAGRGDDAREEAAILARLNAEQRQPVTHLRYHRGSEVP